MCDPLYPNLVPPLLRVLFAFLCALKVKHLRLKLLRQRS